MEQFAPRISVRVYPVILWDHEPPVVLNDFRMRYGLMPDGSEVELGRTVDQTLARAFEDYMMILSANLRYGWPDWPSPSSRRLVLDLGRRYVLPYRDTWIPQHPVARVLAFFGGRRVKRWVVAAWRRVRGRKTLRIEGYEMSPLDASRVCMDKLGVVKEGPVYKVKGDYAAAD